MNIVYNSLEKLAEDDPYFRTEDWGVSFGRGIARQELRDEFLNIIRNHNLPLLAELVIESIRGDKFSNDIRCDLRNIVIDSSSFIDLVLHPPSFQLYSQPRTRYDYMPLVSLEADYSHIDLHSSL